MAGSRILLKLSGELLSGRGGFGIDGEKTLALAARLEKALAAARGTQLAVVMGGGNVLRGARFAGKGVDRLTSDNMGMLATVMNGLALQSCFEKVGVDARVLSAIAVGTITEEFSHRRAADHLEKGRIVILVGGTGQPFFTTDTTAALRGLQIEADLLAKGTKVKGVYSDDPVHHPDAGFLEKISCREYLEKGLRILDATAVLLCMENHLPIRVFDMWEEGSLEGLLRGEEPGSLIS